MREALSVQAEPSSEDDRAWVAIDTSLDVAELRTLINDVELMFRINPLLEFHRFEQPAPERLHLRAHNHSNGRELDSELLVTRLSDGLDIRYPEGLKAATTFRAEAHGPGSRFVVTDIYSGLAETERQARLGEVDASLNAWGRALHDFFRLWARWHRLSLWRWYMRRVWQPMTPSARRIVFLILAVSAFEIATMAVVVLIWLAVR
jgi:hypothetical protein